MTESMLTTIKGKLVVSRQALEQELLHGAQIMARMALAAQQVGGAAAIRVNGLADVTAVCRPVIAEGNVLMPAMVVRCLQLGCHAVVVGGVITRPQQITARFVSAMKTGKASAGNED